MKVFITPKGILIRNNTPVEDTPSYIIERKTWTIISIKFMPINPPICFMLVHKNIILMLAQKNLTLFRENI